MLKVDDLHVWYELKRFGLGHAGYVRAVDGVSFELNAGEAMACVGESGCGKSSLMKTILRLNKPTKGTIDFKGINVGELDGLDLRDYRSKVGFIQQDPFGALAPFMTIQQILEEPLVINGFTNAAERQSKIETIMEEVKLTPVEEILPKFPHMLSGGQQQRVVIARAMILEPDLLVADEPVSMLDASVRVEILKLLRNLQEKHNLAVIYITHDLSTVRYFSEYIFVMYAGQIVEFAPIKSLLENPTHPYTQALLEASGDPDAKNALEYKEIPPGEPPSLVNPPSGCRFHPRCKFAIKGKCDVDMPKPMPVVDGSNMAITGNKHVAACWLVEEEWKERAGLTN